MVKITPMPGPIAPAGVVAQAHDGAVVLSWQKVASRNDGTPVAGNVTYNIYRGAEHGEESERPLNSAPLAATTYKDSAVINGRTYYYVLRSIETVAPRDRSSLDSPEVSATPTDMTPPGRPTGLTAVAGVDRVFLTWDENTDRDIAGYHVYRSTRSGREFTRLTDTAIARTTFYDETARGGATYYYAVTAVDKAGNESGFSGEKTVFVEKLR